MSILARLNVDRSLIEEFCRRRHIVEMSVFGSAARDELDAQSDVDLMVTFASDARWDLYDYVAMCDELAVMFGRTVDLVDLVERGTVRNPYRQRSIEQDLTTLYAA